MVNAPTFLPPLFSFLKCKGNNKSQSSIKGDWDIGKLTMIK